jgi:hypothetical protein
MCSWLLVVWLLYRSTRNRRQPRAVMTASGAWRRLLGFHQGVIRLAGAGRDRCRDRRAVVASAASMMQFTRNEHVLDRGSRSGFFAGAIGLPPRALRPNTLDLAAVSFYAGAVIGGSFVLLGVVMSAFAELDVLLDPHDVGG